MFRGREAHQMGLIDGVFTPDRYFNDNYKDYDVSMPQASWKDKLGLGGSNSSFSLFDDFIDSAVDSQIKNQSLCPEALVNELIYEYTVQNSVRYSG